MESARLATDHDLVAMESVGARVAATMADARGGDLFLAQERSRGPLPARVARALEGGGRAVVGTYDDVVLGFGLATIETLPDGRRIGVIEALAVDPEARGAGIGEAMMNLLLSELRAAGCAGADSRALPGDRETKNFFESFGLKARLLVVHQRFDTPGSGDGDATTPT